MNCHICNGETDFTCVDCGEAVCEECCVQMTLHNQIDYVLCTICGDGREAERSRFHHAEYLKEQEIKAKKDARSAKARANYRKPENIEKRRVAKIERRKRAAELRKKQMEQAARIVSNMFRGMF